MGQRREEIVAWVGSNIVPHEASLRAWLRRIAIYEDEIDDIVQDAYLSIARLDNVAHIRNARGYLFQTARNVVLTKIRRNRIVQIDCLTELQAASLADDRPSPERQVGALLELERVRRLIAALPDRCRQIFELRRIQGISQREISRQLGVPEHTVEAQSIRGLKLILKAIAGEDSAAETTPLVIQETVGDKHRVR